MSSFGSHCKLLIPYLCILIIVSNIMYTERLVTRCFRWYGCLRNSKICNLQCAAIFDWNSKETLVHLHNICVDISALCLNTVHLVLFILKIKQNRTTYSWRQRGCYLVWRNIKSFKCIEILASFFREFIYLSYDL